MYDDILFIIYSLCCDPGDCEKGNGKYETNVSGGGLSACGCMADYICCLSSVYVINRHLVNLKRFFFFRDRCFPALWQSRRVI